MKTKMILLAYKNSPLFCARNINLAELPGFNITQVSGVEAAIEQFQRMQYDGVVVLDFSVQDADKLTRLFGFQQPGIPLIAASSHTTDWITALSSTLENMERRTFRVVDDALQSAMLPIQIS